MAAEDTKSQTVPTSRPVVTAYLQNDFYKAALQWLADKDERSMAWLVAKLVEARVDKAIASGEIPPDVVETLKTKDGE